MSRKEVLQALITDCSPNNVILLFRTINPGFLPNRGSDLSKCISGGESIESIIKIGTLNFEKEGNVVVAIGKTVYELNSRRGKRQQYDIAKRIISQEGYSGGVFFFYDGNGHLRISFIQAIFSGIKRVFSKYKRYTFYASSSLPNKTLLKQFEKADFSSIANIQRTFSIEAVSDDFYNEFKPHYDAIAESVRGRGTPEEKREFALLFIMRIIFIGFLQKKGWLGGKDGFLTEYWKTYLASKGKNEFYNEWLVPIFFDVFNKPISERAEKRFHVAFRDIIRSAPYLNGELFKGASKYSLNN